MTDGYTPKERNQNKGCVGLVTIALLAVAIFIGAYVARMGWDAAAQETTDAC